MQASLGNNAMGEGDNEDVHFEDTVRGSDWGADQQVVRMFVNTAPEGRARTGVLGRALEPGGRRGVHESVINAQRVQIREKDEAHGLITARDFGGTKKWRTCHTSDGTGHAMLYALGDQTVAGGIPVLERQEALALIHDGGRCHGAVVRDLVTGEC
jgi:fumarate reductase flavoprotein subunit